MMAERDPAGQGPLPVKPAFWRGKRVLLSGHTGFKGGWLALWLHRMGANVSGLALAPDTTPSLYDLARISELVPGGIADLRDEARVTAIVAATRPEIVLHLAAQPLVGRSVHEPRATFAANVMGTVNLLEAIRESDVKPQAVLVVTTDKVYENPETGAAFVESDPLGGHDPYSASKAATEIVVASYARTYFARAGVPVATARGGNVIGGGDFSGDRIVPDVVRAMLAGKPVVLRNPHATRPWQHVLDCLAGYLAYTEALAGGDSGSSVPLALNFGPDPTQPLAVAALVDALQAALGARTGWRAHDGEKPHEMQALALDSSRARHLLGWHDRLLGTAALDATASWYQAWRQGQDARSITLREIDGYMNS